MKKNILDRKFIHNSWFKNGVTRRYALEYFAKTSDFILSKKPSKKQSMNLFDDTIYDDVITDGHSSYRLCDEEKDYYIERKAYYDEQKKIEEERWLNSEIDFEKEIKIFLAGHSFYDIKGVKYELETCLKKYSSDLDSINYWKKELDQVTKTHDIIDNMIAENKNKIKTNKEFMLFKKQIDAIQI